MDLQGWCTIVDSVLKPAQSVACALTAGNWEDSASGASCAGSDFLWACITHDDVDALGVHSMCGTEVSKCAVWVWRAAYSKNVLVSKPKLCPVTGKPQQKFHTILIGPVLQALWWDASSTQQFSYQWHKTSAILAELHENMGHLAAYDDFFHGTEYLKNIKNGNIQDDDIVLMFSIDGAQFGLQIWSWLNRCFCLLLMSLNYSIINAERTEFISVDKVYMHSYTWLMRSSGSGLPSVHCNGQWRGRLKIWRKRYGSHQNLMLTCPKGDSSEIKSMR